MQNSYQKTLYAIVSGVLLWLGWAPHTFTVPILWVALVPLLLVLEQIIQSKNLSNKGKKIFGYAFLTNLIWNVSCVYWIYFSIAAYNDPLPAFLISLIPFVLMPLLMSIPYWILYQLRKKQYKYLAYLAFITSWIALEYLQQSWQLAFPWMNLGNGMAQLHQILQWYEFTGVYGGTLWVLLINILVLQCFQQKFKSKKLTLISLLVIFLPVSFSLYQYFTYTENPNPSKVIVVQPNIDPYGKNNGSIDAKTQIQILTKLSDSLAQPDIEYFIWPETAIADYTDENKILANHQFSQIQSFLYKYKNANLISGVNGFKSYKNANESKTASLNPNNHLYYDSFNSAIQLDNNPNVQIYHKSKLVPGVERMPFANYLGFLKPYLAHFGGSIGGFGYQNQPSIFHTQSGIATAPIICYESIWGNWVAQAVNNGAQFIAIMTNDAWWGNTSGKDQHAQYAKLRAIENRRWVARSANTGISCFINARGDILQKTKWWTATTLKQDINLNSALTFYSQNGDIVPKFACVIFLIIGLYYIIALLKNKNKTT